MVLSLAETGAASAQDPQTLNPIVVSPATPRGNVARPGNEQQGAAKRAKRAARQTAPKHFDRAGPIVALNLQESQANLQNPLVHGTN